MKSHKWLLPGAVALATLITYWPVLSNGFVNWDDDDTLRYLVANLPLSWQSLRWMFTTYSLGHWQPLSWLSLFLDHALWGPSPAGYHLTSLILHAANAILFYLISLSLLGDGQKTDESGDMIFAAISALLFALHPMRVESVAWMTERRDVLSGFFFLAAVWFYLDACRRPQMPARGQRLVVMCCLFSTLAKYNGMTLPAALLILDVYPLKRLPADPRGWLPAASRKIVYEKIPLVLISILASPVAIAAQRSARAVVSLQGFTLTSRIAQAAFGLGFYIWKSLLPIHLYTYYEKSFLLDPAPFWAFGLLALALSVATWSLRKCRPALFAGWVYYVLAIFPVLGLIKVSRCTATDHYTYLPCLPVALIVAGAYRLLWRSAAIRAKPLALACGMASILILGGLTWRQTHVWRDSVSLWSRVVGCDAHSYWGHEMLANAYLKQGRLRQAAYHISLSRKNLALCYNTAGSLLDWRGDHERAALYFQRVLELFPDDCQARRGLDSNSPALQ